MLKHSMCGGSPIVDPVGVLLYHTFLDVMPAWGKHEMSTYTKNHIILLMYEAINII